MGKLVKKFSNRRRYTIEIYQNEVPNDSGLQFLSILIIHRRPYTIERIVSSWGDEDEIGIGYYLKDLDNIMLKIKNKTARRYFLKEVRKFKLGNGSFSDYLREDRRVDWKKVNKLDEQVLNNRKQDYEKIHGNGSWPTHITNLSYFW